MNKKQKKVLIRIIISAILVIILSVLFKFVELNVWIQAVLYLIPYAVIGYDILKKAVKGIFKGQIFDENFLMAVATVGAIGLGDFREGVAVMLFYQIGELFQSVAVGKSRKNITELMDIRPDYANIERDGKLVGLVYPDFETADRLGLSGGDELEREMENVRGELNKLVAPYERLSKIVLMPNEFEKTPKRSIKRFLYSN